MGAAHSSQNQEPSPWLSHADAKPSAGHRRSSVMRHRSIAEADYVPGHLRTARYLAKIPRPELCVLRSTITDRRGARINSIINSISSRTSVRFSIGRRDSSNDSASAPPSSSHAVAARLATFALRSVNPKAKISRPRASGGLYPKRHIALNRGCHCGMPRERSESVGCEGRKVCSLDQPLAPATKNELKR